MYSYDRTGAAAPRTFTQAVEKAFLEVNPPLSPYERGTSPEKAARSFAVNAAEAFEHVINSRVGAWVDKVAKGQVKLVFRTLSTDSMQSSYTDEGYDGETHYYYDVDYPSSVRARQNVLLKEDILVREAVKVLYLEVDLKDKGAAQVVLSHPDVRRVLPDLLEAHLKDYDADGPMFGEAGEAAEQYIGREMHVSPDSDKEDEDEMGIEGHIKISLKEAVWKVLHERGLSIAIEVVYRAGVEVLWPGDRGYEEYY